MRFVEEARKRQGEKDNQMSRSEGAMQRWGEAQGASVTSVMKAIWLSALKITEQDTVISSNNSTYFTWFKRMPNCDTMTTHVGENKNTTQTTIGEFMSIHRNTHRGGCYDWWQWRASPKSWRHPSNIRSRVYGICELGGQSSRCSCSTHDLHAEELDFLNPALRSQQIKTTF